MKRLDQAQLGMMWFISVLNQRIYSERAHFQSQDLVDIFPVSLKLAESSKFFSVTGYHPSLYIKVKYIIPEYATAQFERAVLSAVEESSHEIDGLNSIDAMTGEEFEELCVSLLRKKGFQNVKKTKASGDQGIDIVAEKNKVLYGIQCKCYTGIVGNSAVQEALSGKLYYNCHVAVVLTNSYFTQAAKTLAEKNGVVLWNRKDLQQMIRKEQSG